MSERVSDKRVRRSQNGILFRIPDLAPSADPDSDCMRSAFVLSMCAPHLRSACALSMCAQHVCSTCVLSTRA
eukprot:223235-Pyramimonas_sp.AAC.1